MCLIDKRVKPLQNIGKIQAPDLCNGSIAVTLQEFGDLTTEDLIIEDQTAQIG